MYDPRNCSSSKIQECTSVPDPVGTVFFGPSGYGSPRIGIKKQNLTKISNPLKNLQNISQLFTWIEISVEFCIFLDSRILIFCKRFLCVILFIKIVAAIVYILCTRIRTIFLSFSWKLITPNAVFLYQRT
jgi:hypothetical protein